MVKIKYSALYTDDFGCEQAEIYVLNNSRLVLKVRNCIFRNDDLDFDFFSNDADRINDRFHLKGNELIKYFMDVKIPLILTYKGVECINECFLRIERDYNHYKNSLLILLNGNSYVADGYNLRELLKNMKNKLPKDYDLEDNLSCIFEGYYLEINKGEDFYNLDSNYEELNNEANTKLYSYLSSIDDKNSIERLQKIPINYTSGEYYSS